MTTGKPAIQFDSGSFRDPDTRVFNYDGAVFRCLTARALTDWQRLAATDFSARFMAARRLIPTRLVTDRESLPPLAARWAAVLEHERLPVVSYPYEWSFGMLKDAALLQLDVTRAALDEEMMLKGRDRVQRPMARRAPHIHRHRIVHTVRRGRTLRRLPAVLRDVPLSAAAAGVPQRAVPPLAAWQSGGDHGGAVPLVAVRVPPSCGAAF